MVLLEMKSNLLYTQKINTVKFIIWSYFCNNLQLIANKTTVFLFLKNGFDEYEINQKAESYSKALYGLYKILVQTFL